MFRTSLLTGVAMLAIALPSTAAASISNMRADNAGSLALTVLPSRTAIDSGGALATTVVVRSTGTETATGVRTCLAPPPQLTVEQARRATRAGRRVCFSLGDMAAGAEASRTITLRAAASRTVNVRITAGASSACACSGHPFARSPVIRIVRKPADPKVTG